MTPIQLYTYQTPNGHKASIMLEETGLPYDVHIVDIEKGEQNSPAFLALNPNNKIPVIVDPDRNRTVVESGAILLYLAERSGVLRPQTRDRGRADAPVDAVPGGACRADARPALELQDLRPGEDRLCDRPLRARDRPRPCACSTVSWRRAATSSATGMAPPT